MNAVKPCNILLPNEKVDLFAYSCVACDQFTGDEKYWQEVEKITKDKPSTYHITFPEIYLSKDNSERIARINANMEDYLAKGVFREIEDAIIFVQRTLDNGKIRKGLVLAVDLEQYEYYKGTRSAVRPTEGTIEDRLPPRVAIRKNAPLELPHIMLLINDEKKQIIEALEEKDMVPLYETDLMMRGGRLKGYALTDSAKERVLSQFASVACGTDDNVICFAVGDGNHSLATAKKCWETVKETLSEEEKLKHPARFALCEVVNLHSEALEFEPIHRILYNVDEDAFLKALEENSSPDGQKITVITGKGEKEFSILPTHCLTVGSIQNIIDKHLASFGGEVDYIHEPEQVRKNVTDKKGIGILISGLDKSELFPAVLKNGALPRKTFSMGMGIDKRYYFEARKIK
ncbi:MAG: DUF1015 domain-containing protein [Clostridia bacterium]|nr:DUF1015 domain-containing protein [Clostridia bacterium]